MPRPNLRRVSRGEPYRSEERRVRIAGLELIAPPGWAGVSMTAILGFAFAQYVIRTYGGGSPHEYVAVTIGGSAAILATIYVHQLGHALAARLAGLNQPCLRARLGDDFRDIEHALVTPKQVLKVALAGPAASVAFGALVMCVALATGYFDHRLATAFGFFAILNFLLAVFHLLPGFPGDGGHAVEAFMWWRGGDRYQARKRVARLGRETALAVYAAGFMVIALGYLAPGVFVLVGAWTLDQGARLTVRTAEAAAALSGLPAASVMRDDFPTVSPETPLDSIVWDHFAKNPRSIVAVEHRGAALGLIALLDVHRVAARDWSTTIAGDAMTRRELVVAVDADTPAAELLQRLAAVGEDKAVVLRDNRMIGVVSALDLDDRVGRTPA